MLFGVLMTGYGLWSTTFQLRQVLVVGNGKGGWVHLIIPTFGKGLNHAYPS